MYEKFWKRSSNNKRVERKIGLFTEKFCKTSLFDVLSKKPMN